MPVGVGVQMHAVNTTASLTQPTQWMAYRKLPVVRSQTIAGAEYRSCRLQLNGRQFRRQQLLLLLSNSWLLWS